MQDRYAGDVGDFLKYGLLRWLTMATDNEPALSLGVVWYRTPDEYHNEDGKHTSYLEHGHPAHDRLRRLDPDLHDCLRSVLSIERSVAEVERSGALPAGTFTYSRRLTFTGVSSQDRPGRVEARQRWLEGAVATAHRCDVVFADPDNGIRRADHQTPRHRDRSEKHAYVDELAQLAGEGAAIVVYHHADRSAPLPEQAQRRLQDLGTAVHEPIAAVRASRGTTRLFLVAGAGSRRMVGTNHWPLHKSCVGLWCLTLPRSFDW